MIQISPPIWLVRCKNNTILVVALTLSQGFPSDHEKELIFPQSYTCTIWGQNGFRTKRITSLQHSPLLLLSFLLHLSLFLLLLPSLLVMMIMIMKMMIIILHAHPLKRMHQRTGYWNSLSSSFRLFLYCSSCIFFIVIVVAIVIDYDNDDSDDGYSICTSVQKNVMKD